MMVIEQHELLKCISHSTGRSAHLGGTQTHLNPKMVEGAASCTTLAVKTASDGVYLAVATAEVFVLYIYNQSAEKFVIKKVGNMQSAVTATQNYNGTSSQN